MFLYNRGYHSTLNDVSPAGVILCTSLLDHPTLKKRNFDYKVNMALLDPQIYLWSVDENECLSTHKKIISYPWVKTMSVDDPLRFDAGCIITPKTDAEITACLTKCFEIQKSFGATQIIIPTPLAIAREDQFSEQLRWLELAEPFKNKYDEPFFATIALSDKTLLNCKFENNLMLQTILDNAALMQHIDGYYIVVERDSPIIQIVEVNIARALLELTYNLGHCQDKAVVVNFADVFGLVCMAVGATAFGSGYTTKERRLSFDDFIDQKGGMALPRYYSSNLIGDFYSERDLNKIIGIKLLRYISEDIITSHSNVLITALKQKNSVDKIAAWKESRSNTAAASKHRVACLTKQVSDIMQYNTIEEKLECVLIWIQDAEAKMEYLKSRLKDDPLNEDGRHLSVWRKALDEFMISNKL
ncbi:hypothetical protein SAMN05660742_11034 [Propionispira arboris]|uniref:Uncharacterized protein n=1 Tax=Propionispira arboris TaxID=84035 RepID=A0A1H6ZQA2_9FIRM|nr:hypothetical protein [Propionispira arboris]SEJ54856.1 hypothetical protein SAMN05660742_11034 [Propionispira arboris]